MFLNLSDALASSTDPADNGDGECNKALVSAEHLSLLATKELLSGLDVKSMAIEEPITSFNYLQRKLTEPIRISLGDHLAATKAEGNHDLWGSALARLQKLEPYSQHKQSAMNLGLMGFGLKVNAKQIDQMIATGILEVKEGDHKEFKPITRSQIGIKPDATFVNDEGLFVVLDPAAADLVQAVAVDVLTGWDFSRRSIPKTAPTLNSLTMEALSSGRLNEVGWWSPFQAQFQIPIWALRGLVVKPEDVANYAARLASVVQKSFVSDRVSYSEATPKLLKHTLTYPAHVSVYKMVSLADPMPEALLTDVTFKRIVYSREPADWLHFIGSDFEVAWGHRSYSGRFIGKLVNLSRNGNLLVFLEPNGNVKYIDRSEVKSIQLNQYNPNGSQPGKFQIYQSLLSDPDFRKFLKEPTVLLRPTTIVP